MKHVMAIVLYAAVLGPGLSGCITDNLVDFGNLTSGITPGNQSCDGGPCNDDSNVTSKTETQLNAEGYLYGGYGLFFEANTNWAPGVIESFPERLVHEGWEQSRCFECHGVGMEHEPEDHDPRMQYWPWSCARGFPNSSCHGHGVNGTPLFNHDFDPEFDNCTQAGCHDQYDVDKEFENHGFAGAPDSFCNACHDWSWEAWPEDPLAVSSTTKPY